jgi:2,4-dienoyl-CoA reductase-like NADH-dependent reductase (Old Yellow Enzyme family)
MLATGLRLPNGTLLRHRIAKAAMEEALSDPHQDPTPELARLYRRWADGGAALLITGHVLVDRTARARPRDVVVEDERASDRLSAWADAARSAGAEVWMQLNHAGRQTPRHVARVPVAPSAVPAVKLLASFGRPRALREDEIHDLVARFARAAVIAERAGFTGVQVHAAHGYLISQFLSPLTNTRDDAWGGPIENRARFLLDVVRAIRGAVKKTTAVAVKLNSADFQRGGFDEHDFGEVVRMLDAEGIDLLEISGGNYESPALFKGTSSSAREAYFLEFARAVRALTKVPIMVTGGFRSRAVMEQALVEGAVDVIGLARPLALEPDLPRRLLDGTAERSTVTTKDVFVKSLSVVADGAWSWMQIRRMAHGEAPDPGLSTWTSLLYYLFFDLFLSKTNIMKMGAA